MFRLLFRDIIFREHQYRLKHIYIVSTYKGKAIPLQALTGPEGFRRLRLPDFKTIAT
jgi:hypothetical protein